KSGNGSKRGRGVADPVLPRLPARRIARAKSTINAGRNAILPGKSRPGEIFGKNASRPPALCQGAAERRYGEGPGRPATGAGLVRTQGFCRTIVGKKFV